MSDKEKYLGQNTIHGLVQDLSEKLDGMASELRQNTVFEGMRPSDAKTFTLIARHPRGITDLAVALEISRQAAHKSVQRLIDMDLVSLRYAEGSRRDMVASITPKGYEGRAVELRVSGQIDDYVVKRVGAADLHLLKQLLEDILID